MGTRARKFVAVVVLVGAALGSAGIANASAGEPTASVLAGNRLCC
jgi:hypothetical protein